MAAAGVSTFPGRGVTCSGVPFITLFRLEIIPATEPQPACSDFRWEAKQNLRTKTSERLFGDSVQSVGGGWDASELLSYEVVTAEAVSIEAISIVAINASGLVTVDEIALVEADGILSVEIAELGAARIDRVSIEPTELGIINVKEVVASEADEHITLGASELPTIKFKVPAIGEANNISFFEGASELVPVPVLSTEVDSCDIIVEAVIDDRSVEGLDVERRTEDEHQR